MVNDRLNLMAHLHHPELNELRVIADLNFEESQQQTSPSNKSNMLAWFLKSGIFILSSVVIIAGLTIITYSYLQNTTPTLSQASETSP